MLDHHAGFLWNLVIWMCMVLLVTENLIQYSMFSVCVVAGSLEFKSQVCQPKMEDNVIDVLCEINR
jgi:hypothetical protein